MNCSSGDLQFQGVWNIYNSPNAEQSVEKKRKKKKAILIRRIPFWQCWLAQWSALEKILNFYADKAVQSHSLGIYDLLKTNKLKTHTSVMKICSIPKGNYWFLWEILLQITLACIFSSLLEFISDMGFPGLNEKKLPYNANCSAFELSMLNILGDQPHTLWNYSLKWIRPFRIFQDLFYRTHIIWIFFVLIHSQKNYTICLMLNVTLLYK